MNALNSGCARVRPLHPSIRVDTPRTISLLLATLAVFVLAPQVTHATQPNSKRVDPLLTLGVVPSGNAVPVSVPVDLDPAGLSVSQVLGIVVFPGDDLSPEPWVTTLDPGLAALGWTLTASASEDTLTFLASGPALTEPANLLTLDFVTTSDESATFAQLKGYAATVNGNTAATVHDGFVGIRSPQPRTIWGIDEYELALYYPGQWPDGLEAAYWNDDTGTWIGPDPAVPLWRDFNTASIVETITAIPGEVHQVAMVVRKSGDDTQWFPRSRPARAGATPCWIGGGSQVSSYNEYFNAVAYGDFNLDGFIDIYLNAQPYQGQTYPPTRFFVNDGSGSFDPLGVEGVLPDGRACFGDFDGNGAVDLVATGSGFMQIFMNDGAGHLVDATSSLLPGVASPTSLALLDVNRDGRLDFITAGPGAAYLQQPNGEFVEVTASVFPSERPTSFVDMADVDLDGDLDLGFSDSGGTRVLLQTAPGVFGTAIDTPSWGFCGFGDANGDGWFDIATSVLASWSSYAVGTRQWEVQLGDGSGAFSPYDHVEPVYPRFGWPAHWYDPDLDGDLDLALVGIPEENGGILLFNDGNAQFSQSNAGLRGVDFGWWNDGTYRMTTADVDGDGRESLSAIIYRDLNNLGTQPLNSDQHWLKIVCEGSISNTMGIGAQVEVHTGDQVQRRVVRSTNFDGMQGESAAFFGLGAHSTVDSLVVIWPRTGARRQVRSDVATDQILRVHEELQVLDVSLVSKKAITQAPIVQIEFNSAVSIAAAQQGGIVVTGDRQGILPYAMSTAGSRALVEVMTTPLAGETLTISLTSQLTDTAAVALEESFVWQFTQGAADGKGTYGEEVAFVTDDLMGSVAGDFDGDGDADLALIRAFPNYDCVLLERGVAGDFAPASAPLSVAVAPVSILSADVNADGHLDVVIGTWGQHQVVVGYGDGDLGFSSNQIVSVPAPAHKMAAGDLDGDGWIEVVVATWSGNSLLYLDNVGGQLSVPQALSTGVEYRDVAIGDLDDDGDLDLVAAVTDLGRVEIWENDGTGSLALVSNIAVPSVNSLALCNVDDDASLDLAAVPSQAPWLVYRFVNDGQGGYSVAPSGNPSCGATPDYLEAADLDDDGLRDLILGRYESGELEIWMSGSDAGEVLSPSNSESANPRSMAIADFDGNGTLDLAVPYKLPYDAQVPQSTCYVWYQDPATAVPGVAVGHSRFLRVYPNPFNPQVTLEFSTAHEASVLVTVHDLAGRRLRTLVDGARMDGGRHSVVWRGDDVHGRSVASGVYICRLAVEGVVDSRQVVLVR